jgi:DNA-binding transcriptional MocR family regulator
VDHPNPRWPLERAVLAARIPPVGKLVMLTLLAKTGSSSLDLGKWSPGTRTLAEQTGLSREIVIKHLGLLEAHGWLAVRKRKGLRPEYALSEGQPFRGSDYKHTPPKRGGPESRTSSGEAGTKSPTTGGTKSPTTGGPINGTTVRPPDRRSDRSDREPDPERCGDWRDDLQPWAPIRYG